MFHTRRAFGIHARGVKRDVVWVWSTTKGREGEQRLVCSGASAPFAWVSADEYVHAALDGARVGRLGAEASHPLPDSSPATGVFADVLGQRIAVARRSEVRFYVRQ